MEIAYAQALWQTIAGGTNPRQALSALHDALVVRGRTGLLPRIARAFKRIAEREMRKNRIVLSVAHGKDEHAIPRNFKDLFSQVGIDTKDIETRVDDTLIGGWRMEGREQLIDASHKKYLLQIYNAVTKN